MAERTFSIALGLTLPIPNLNFGMIKPELRIDGLDPSGDVEAQINEVIVASKIAFPIMAEELADQLATLTPRSKVEELEKTVNSVRDRLNDMIRRLNAKATLAAAEETNE